MKKGRVLQVFIVGYRHKKRLEAYNRLQQFVCQEVMVSYKVLVQANASSESLNVTFQKAHVVGIECTFKDSPPKKSFLDLLLKGKESVQS